MYVFAKNEDSRSRWIKTLKDSQCIPVILIIIPMFVSARSGGTRSWKARLNVKARVCAHLCAVVRCNKDLLQKYHPCSWMDGVWLCCHQEVKQAMGCKVLDSKNGENVPGLAPSDLQHDPKSGHPQDLPGTPTEERPGNLFLRPRQRYGPASLTPPPAFVTAPSPSRLCRSRRSLYLLSRPSRRAPR